MLCIHDRRVRKVAYGSPQIGPRPVGAGDVRADRRLLPALRHRPRLGPEPRIRHRGRPARRPAGLLPALGRGPRRPLHGRPAGHAHPCHGTVRARQLGPPAGQHALPLRLRRDDRGTPRPPGVRPLLRGLRLSRPAGLRRRQRRLAADAGGGVRCDLGDPGRVFVPLPRRPRHKPLPVPLLPPAALPGLADPPVLGDPPVGGGGPGVLRARGGVSGARGGVRAGLRPRVGATSAYH